MSAIMISTRRIIVVYPIFERMSSAHLIRSDLMYHRPSGEAVGIVEVASTTVPEKVR